MHKSDKNNRLLNDSSEHLETKPAATFCESSAEKSNDK